LFPFWNNFQNNGNSQWTIHLELTPYFASTLDSFQITLTVTLQTLIIIMAQHLRHYDFLMIIPNRVLWFLFYMIIEYFKTSPDSVSKRFTRYGSEALHQIRFRSFKYQLSNKQISSDLIILWSKSVYHIYCYRLGV
jgi:hypothetical protein